LNWEVDLTDSNLNEDPRIADARSLLKALEAGKLSVGEPGSPATAARIHRLRRQIADADARTAQRHAHGR
jgi:hypothetical protein